MKQYCMRAVYRITKDLDFALARLSIKFLESKRITTEVKLDSEKQFSSRASFTTTSVGTTKSGRIIS